MFWKFAYSLGIALHWYVHINIFSHLVKNKFVNIYSIEALKVVFSHKEFIMKENIAIDLKMEK